MPATVVLCSIPNCGEVATTKVAAPWKGGSHAELKIYGYACASHVYQMMELAKGRPDLGRLGPEESLGEIDTYPLARV